MFCVPQSAEQARDVNVGFDEIKPHVAQILGDERNAHHFQFVLFRAQLMKNVSCRRFVVIRVDAAVLFCDPLQCFYIVGKRLNLFSDLPVPALDLRQFVND